MLFSLSILTLSDFSFESILSYPNSNTQNRNVFLFTVEREAFQGVEFTEISCRKCELGWSRFDGMTSRCKGLRATVSSENEGRKFGSLTGKKEQPIKLDSTSRTVIFRKYVCVLNFLQLTSANIPILSLQQGDPVP